MSEDFKIFQPYAAWICHFLLYTVIGLKWVNIKYLEQFGCAWRDWLKSAYIIIAANLGITLLWAGACYFVWASEDPHTHQKPATWDSKREAIILFFGTLLPITNALANMIFWGARQIAVGTLTYVLVLLLNIVAFVLILVNGGQDALTAVMIALPMLWLVVFIFVCAIAWYHTGGNAPKRYRGLPSDSDQSQIQRSIGSNQKSNNKGSGRMNICK